MTTTSGHVTPRWELRYIAIWDGYIYRNKDKMRRYECREVGFLWFGDHKGYTDLDRAAILALRIGQSVDIGDNGGHLVLRVE